MMKQFQVFAMPPLMAMKTGEGCSVPIFNLDPIHNAEAENAFLEWGKCALVRAILEDLGVDGLIGFDYRTQIADDHLYDRRTAVIDTFVNGVRYGLALKYRWIA